MRLFFIICVTFWTSFVLPAVACGPEVHIQFAEASPDQFRISFTRGPKLRLKSLTISLNGSAAGAVYDDENGLETQGPQPSPSGVIIQSIAYRTAKDHSAMLTFSNFTESRNVTFHSDLDDRGLASDYDQNHLVDGEIEGATASAILISETGRRIEIYGRFDKKSHARLGERACV